MSEPIQPESLPRLLTAPELATVQLPAREIILDPILTSKTLALLYGPRGLGKTFVALGIAWAAASGSSFLGWRASRPHRVVYVDGEMAADEMRQRLLGFGPPPPNLNLMLSDLHRGDSLDLANGYEFAAAARHWGRPELLVIDNLASVAGFKSGDADRWHELQRCLMVYRRLGCAVLLVHHANKKGAQRGTSRREDVVDIVMAMRRPADYEPQQGARFEIHFEKARGLYGAAIEPIEAQLRTDEAGQMHWDTQFARITELDQVAALIKDGLSGNDIAQTLRMSRARAYRLRNRAFDMGLAERPGAPLSHSSP